MVELRTRPCRALVVEDDPFIALDLAEKLTAEHFEVAGTAHSIDAAISLIRCMKIDVAVLDYLLGAQPATPVAHELRDRKIPFLVVTGFDDLRDPEFAGVDVLTKPTRSCELAAHVKALLR